MQLDKFRAASFEQRTDTVKVDALSEWFAGDPVWKVRGLSTSELLKCNTAGDRQKNLMTAVEAVAGGQGKDRVTATRQILGIEGSQDSDMAKRLEMLTIASVEPKIELSDAVKLGNYFPAEFMLLTSTIMRLTAEGADSVKPKPSGKTQK